MSFPSLGYFWENPGCHSQKILLETVIICACVDFTTILPTAIEVNHTAHSLDWVCQRKDNTLGLDSHYYPCYRYVAL